MVANDTTGNMIRPPYRSVRAPTGMRPSAPTITGTATSRACWKLVSPSDCLKCAPSGDSRAHAQKVSANPPAAIPSMRYGWRLEAGSPAVRGVVMGSTPRYVYLQPRRPAGAREGTYDLT